MSIRVSILLLFICFLNKTVSSQTLTAPVFQRNQLTSEKRSFRFSKVVFDTIRVRTQYKISEIKPADFLRKNNLIPVNNVKSNISLILNPLGNVQKEFSVIIQRPLRLQHVEFLYEGVSGQAENLRVNTYYLSNARVQTSWLIGTVPFNTNLQHQNWRPGDKFMGNLDFDQDKYLMMIREKLKGKFDPEELLNGAEDLGKRMADQAKQSLTGELQALNEKYKGLLDDQMTLLKQFTDLNKLDPKELEHKLLSASTLGEIEQKSNLLDLLQQKKNLGEKINEEEFVALQNEVSKYSGIRELLKRIGAHKSKWESSGLLEKIRQLDVLKRENIKQLLNDPSTIRELARKHLSLKGIEKMFLNMNKLGLGQNATSLSPLSFKGFLSGGMVTEFLNKGKSIFLMAGAQKDFNSILDYSFTDQLNSNSGFAKALQLQLGNPKSSSTHLTLSSFNQSLVERIAAFQPADFRKILVTTISNELKLKKNGVLAIDISKSAAQYSSLGKSDSTLASQSPINNILSSDGFFNNSAVAIKYTDELPASQLNYQFSFNRVANGYVNPGNTFLNHGGTEIGMMVRKLFLKDRVQLSLRSNQRSFDYDLAGDSRWRSRFATLDLRFRMRKGQSISLRYQPTKMTRVGSSNQLVSSTERVSLDASLFKRMQKLSYRNNLSLNYLSSTYLFSNKALSTKSIAINSYQNLSIKNNLLYVNSSFNCSNNQSGLFYLNSSLLIESGYSFQLFKKLVASSGLVYNNVEGWYEQIGFRQSLNGQVGKGLDISLYLDARKNLELIQPLWNQPLRADISIRYLFSN